MKELIKILLIIYSLSSVVCILILAQKIIWMKKIIYFKYICNNPNFILRNNLGTPNDGGWLVKYLDLEKIPMKLRNSTELILYTIKIQRYIKILVALFISVLLAGYILDLMK